MNNTTTVKIQCPDCLRLQVLEFPYSFAEYAVRYKKWKAGTLIQKASPELDANQREALITGICQECWEKIDDSSFLGPF